MSKRIEQVNELIRSIIGRVILTELELPLGTIATVTKVKTAKDLKNTTVFLSIIPNNKTLSTFDFLRKKIGLLQHHLGEQLTFRYTPRITLKIDYTEQEANKIEALLDSLQK